MEKNKIVMVGTPSDKTSIIYDILKKYFKSIEYIYIDLDNKIDGTKPSSIVIDDMQNSTILLVNNLKKREDDATLKVAGTN